MQPVKCKILEIESLSREWEWVFLCWTVNNFFSISVHNLVLKRMWIRRQLEYESDQKIWILEQNSCLIFWGYVQILNLVKFDIKKCENICLKQFLDISPRLDKNLIQKLNFNCILHKNSAQTERRHCGNRKWFIWQSYLQVCYK